MSDSQLYHDVARKAESLIDSSAFASGIDIRLLIAQVIVDHYGFSLSPDTSQRLYTQVRLVAAYRWGAIVQPSDFYNHDKINMLVRMGPDLREILGEEGFRELCETHVRPFLKQVNATDDKIDQWIQNTLVAHPDASK